MPGPMRIQGTWGFRGRWKLGALGKKERIRRLAEPKSDQGCLTVLVTQWDRTLHVGSDQSGGGSQRFGESPKQEVVWLRLQFPIFLIAGLSRKGQWDRFNSGFPNLSTPDIWGCTFLCCGGAGCPVRGRILSSTPWASTYEMPGAPSICDKQECPQNLPNVPWAGTGGGGESPALRSSGLTPRGISQDQGAACYV